MKVTYLAHSGFTVELEQCILIFDYYQGELPKWDRQKPIYVFVSHKHHDHFQLRIFDLLSQYEKVHFYLGSDIRLSHKYLERNGMSPSVTDYMTHMGKNVRISRDGLQISTLRSTDAGVAYLIETEGTRIYHAGDLNWWHWEGESESWNRNMKQAYQKEIDKLAGTDIDIAFVPLDPRLGAAYRLGADYFMEKVGARYLFPMHLWEEYEWIEQYKGSPQAAAWADKTVTITERGQSWNIL